MHAPPVPSRTALLRAGCVVLACAAEWSAAAEIAWPDVAPPPKARLESIGDNLKVNGRSMRIDHFESALSVAEILAWYHKQWDTAARPAVEARAGDWKTIAAAQGHFFLTVQVKEAPGGASQGMLSVAAVDEVKSTPALQDIPRMGSTRTVTVVESKDRGSTSEQAVLSNGYSVGQNADFYDGQLKFAGWTKLQDNRTTTGALPASGYVAFYERNKVQFNLAITPDPHRSGAVIQANVIRKD